MLNDAHCHFFSSRFLELIAPDSGKTFSVLLGLSTSDGTTVNATIDVTPNKAGVTLPAGPVSIGPAVSTIAIEAAAQSTSRGDTVINVRVGAVTSSFKLTAIRNPEVWFRGRFEARFVKLTRTSRSTTCCLCPNSSRAHYSRSVSI